MIKPIALALTLALVPAAAAPALAMEPRIATLNASGAGEVSVAPDIAIVTIGVVSRAKTAREALDTNNAEIAAVIDTILAEGIDEADVGTAGFSVNPVYNTKSYASSSDDEPKVIGYEVANEVSVTIRDLTHSGAVLDKVVSAGANRISGIRFDIADRAAASDKAVQAAIKEARRQAELMAAAAGVRLVRILDINASSARPVYARAEVARTASDSVPVMPGRTQVTANANITFEIAPLD